MACEMIQYQAALVKYRVGIIQPSIGAHDTMEFQTSKTDKRIVSLPDTLLAPLPTQISTGQLFFWF